MKGHVYADEWMSTTTELRKIPSLGNFRGGGIFFVLAFAIAAMALCYLTSKDDSGTTYDHLLREHRDDRCVVPWGL